MNENNDILLSEVAGYYATKLREHGATPRGVDWNGEEGQTLRFAQLAKILPRKAFSVADIGCGYGALLHYLGQNFENFEYLGCDISAEMIAAAKVGAPANARFTQGAQPDQISDYCVASGIFNVKLNRSDADWREYVETCVDSLAASSRRGFAFNCLTSYADEDKKRENLYYADPCYWFDRCKRIYSKNVALLHDYDLYEFTIIVRT